MNLKRNLKEKENPFPLSSLFFFLQPAHLFSLSLSFLSAREPSEANGLFLFFFPCARSQPTAAQPASSAGPAQCLPLLFLRQ
jgi:hypothetical protein